jgi:hypothetical protein
MARQTKEQKSAHLKELEDVFERRTRRFSPFEVLGLTSGHDNKTPVESEHAEPSRESQETKLRPTPGMGLPIPPMEGSEPPPHGSSRPTVSTSQISLSSFIADASEPSAIQVGRTAVQHPSASGRSIFNVADVVAATQVGAQIGVKARRVLAYFNSIRSLEYEAYTIPVGYGQISTAAGVDVDYLRRKVIPKLAMLGLIAIARKSLDGTVYHLLHSKEYVGTVTGEFLPGNEPILVATAPQPPEDAGKHSSWPDWIDRGQWGWLSPESIQRLVQKAGSEAQAREKLEIITYNETHGAPNQRVRNRRSVLAHYLSSPQAEIWPNDDGFETLAMKNARIERERAQKEKAVAEEVLKARREAQKAHFYASLSDSQIQWLKQEAKRTVDARPESKMLSSRYPLYKAEEDRLLEEWIDRAQYGETVPSAAKEAT